MGIYTKNIGNYFRESFLRGCDRLHYTFPEDVSVYASGVVERFAYGEGETLSRDIYSDFIEKSPKDARNLKDIGDAALVINGFISEIAKSRKSSFLSDIGRSAYGTLGCSDVILRDLYSRMEYCFEALLDILGYMRHEGAVQSGNVRNIWESFRESSNPVVRDMLKNELRINNVVPLGRH